MGFNLGKTLGDVVKGGAQVVTGGAYNPNDGSWGTGNMRDSFGGLGGYATMAGLDGGNLLSSGGGLFASPGQKAGGGGTDGAYQAQVAAALAGADAAKYTADQQLKLGQAGIDAQLQMANQSMMGGIISAAMAGQKSNIVRKEMMPHEEGAANIASMDLASKWDKTLQMRVAGYSDVAIQHQLQGKSYKPLFRDAEWNAMQMMKLTKQDVMQNAQLFGMKSAQNPTGIAMSEEEYLGMMAMKDPNELLKIDPAMAAERNAQYAAWKSDMMSSGNDLIVQMFENPQLSGASILSMRGKEALIDPRLAPLLENMNQVKEPYDDLDSQLQSYDAASKPKKKVLSDGRVVYVDGNGNPFQPKAGTAVTPGASTTTGGGTVLGTSFGYNEAMEQYNAGRQKIIDEYNRKQHDFEQNLEQKFKWDDAINAMTKGEKNKYSPQIEALQKAGVIDPETGRVNGSALAKMIPPDLLKAPQFDPYRQLTDAEKLAYKDEYKRLSEIKVDPKLVRSEAMGGGITRKIILNPDGTKAATMLEGYATDATGQQRFMSVAGNRTQDFVDRASMINGFGPGGPTARAPISQDRMSGKIERGSDFNYLAQYSTGQKGKSASGAAATAQNATSVPKAGPKLSMPSNPAASAGGAPLAAGDD